MNFLAHAYFSGTSELVLVGNMIGDFVKGKSILSRLEPGIRKGVILHRSIDTFTDKHQVSQRMKNYYRQDFGLFSGAIVDIVYDYAFANDPHYFSNEQELKAFTQNVYDILWRHEDLLPEKFKHILKVMARDNWLYDIRSLNGLHIALQRFSRRSEHIGDIQKAYETTIRHYYELNQCYYDYIEHFENFVKGKLM